ncbi:hypothetical protein E3N88_24026 [Mikania micrantha]|uniref:Uncharacterized protein n=1 Tax=Mikania micrantha TaxID=192012 RepID=A0A5N6NHF8_9ASTR|nr:hypothetical protein E3N88_24026 [Mikania micrantha]
MEHWCNYQFGNGGLLKNLKNFMKQGAYALAVSRELSVWKWGSIVGTAKCGTNYSIYLVSGMHQVRAPFNHLGAPLQTATPWNTTLQLDRWRSVSMEKTTLTSSRPLLMW